MSTEPKNEEENFSFRATRRTIWMNCAVFELRRP